MSVSSDVGRENFPGKFQNISFDYFLENFQYFSNNIIVDYYNNNVYHNFINITPTVLFKLQCLIVQ